MIQTKVRLRRYRALRFCKHIKVDPITPRLVENILTSHLIPPIAKMVSSYVTDDLYEQIDIDCITQVSPYCFGLPSNRHDYYVTVVENYNIILCVNMSTISVKSLSDAADSTYSYLNQYLIKHDSSDETIASIISYAGSRYDLCGKRMDEVIPFMDKTDEITEEDKQYKKIVLLVIKRIINVLKPYQEASLHLRTPSFYRCGND